jgi:predicted phosphodiesterase
MARIADSAAKLAGQRGNWLMSDAATPAHRRLWCSFSALALALAMQPTPAAAATLAAWVQLIGSGRDASIRVITSDARCPALKIDRGQLTMQVRAPPEPLFKPESDVAPASFHILTCEAKAPPGISSVRIDGRSLPLPAANIRRIIVFGDTGCRLNSSKKKQQDCSNDWPYRKIARRAAAAHPDLVIHVGDYLYRESCDPRAIDCSKTPTGYAWEEWRDDFFNPSAPLFAAAPWIMVRGNHETCDRAGEGWFRFLDHTDPSRDCSLITEPFVIALGDMGFVVMDSGQIAKENGGDDNDDDEDDVDESNVADARDSDATAALLGRTFAEISDRIPSPSWLLTHVPFNAVKVKKGADDAIVNTIQQRAVGGLLPGGIEMIVSGHVHMFEALIPTP